MSTKPHDCRFARFERIETVTNWLLDNAYRKQERVAKESGVSPGTIRNLMRREPKENVSMAAISKLERYIELQTKQAIVTPSLSETN